MAISYPAMNSGPGPSDDGECDPCEAAPDLCPHGCDLRERCEKCCWWCPTCKELVEPIRVTHDVRHDERYGGCGERVLPHKPEVRDHDPLTYDDCRPIEQSGYDRAVREIVSWIKSDRAETYGWTIALGIERGDHRPKGNA